MAKKDQEKTTLSQMTRIKTTLKTKQQIKLCKYKYHNKILNKTMNG